MVKAVCVLRDNDGSGVSGTITFEQESNDAPTTIKAEVKGLSEGFYIFFLFFSFFTDLLILF